MSLGPVESLRSYSVCLLGLLALPFSTAVAQISERPNAAGPPTQVDITLFVVDVSDIDDVMQTFTVDFFVNVAWQDPRMVLPEDARLGSIRTLPLDEIWTPRAVIVNDRGLVSQLPRVAEVDDLGNVQQRQRFTGSLAADLDFSEFPFDHQILPLQVISYRYTPDELQFAMRLSDVAETLGAEGWRFEPIDAEVGVYEISAANIERPELVYSLRAERNSGYYVLTMFLPMSLIVFMAWMVFWMQPDLVPARIGISTSSIFTLIAFGFTVRLGLPPVSYLTRADAFVMGCTLLIFLALGVAVASSRLASSDRMAQAVRLNEIARWLYVCLFALVVAISLWVLPA